MLQITSGGETASARVATSAAEGAKTSRENMKKKPTPIRPSNNAGKRRADSERPKRISEKWAMTEYPT